MHAGRRNFRAVWPSLFATSLGLTAFLPVLALYVQERFRIDDPQEVAFWASAIFGAGPLAAACMGPLWGAMGDRYGKKRMAVRANVAIAVATSLMPFAESPVLLLGMRVAQGLFAGFVAPAMSLVTSQLPPAVHGRAIARLQVAMALGSFVGPYVGAEVAGVFGRGALFWIASVASAVSALRLQLSAVEAAPSAEARRRSFFGGFVHGSRQLLQNRVFATLLALLLLMRLGQNMLEPMVALFVAELGAWPFLSRLGGDDALAVDRTIAVAFGVLAVGQWVCTPFWGRLADRHGPLRCLVGLSLGLAAVLSATALVTSIGQFLLARCAVACLMAGSLTLAYAAISKRVADEHRTLAFSLVQSCIQLGVAFGPLVGAAVARTDDGPDYRAAFAAAGALCGAAGAGMFLLRRVERRLTG